MKKEIFEYELTRDEQLIAHAIQYAVATSADMKREYKAVIGLLTVHADIDKHTVDFQRVIDFPRLLELTRQAVVLCYEKLARINACQDRPMDDIERGMELIRELDVKAVLQNTEAEFYDFLVGCCK